MVFYLANAWSLGLVPIYPIACRKINMVFRDKYTTADLIASDDTPDKKEKTKIIISNDALAIGELLEVLINRGLR